VLRPHTALRTASLACAGATSRRGTRESSLAAAPRGEPPRIRGARGPRPRGLGRPQCHGPSVASRALRVPPGPPPAALDPPCGPRQSAGYDATLTRRPPDRTRRATRPSPRRRLTRTTCVQPHPSTTALLTHSRPRCVLLAPRTPPPAPNPDRPRAADLRRRPPTTPSATHTYFRSAGKGRPPSHRRARGGADVPAAPRGWLARVRAQGTTRARLRGARAGHARAQPANRRRRALEHRRTAPPCS
jgi:hypothetical protein